MTAFSTTLVGHHTPLFYRFQFPDSADVRYRYVGDGMGDPGPGRVHRCLGIMWPGGDPEKAESWIYEEDVLHHALGRFWSAAFSAFGDGRSYAFNGLNTCLPLYISDEDVPTFELHGRKLKCLQRLGVRAP